MGDNGRQLTVGRDGWDLRISRVEGAAGPQGLSAGAAGSSGKKA